MRQNYRNWAFLGILGVISGRCCDLCMGMRGVLVDLPRPKFIKEEIGGIFGTFGCLVKPEIAISGDFRISKELVILPVF